jgi:hypothetical protein
VISRLNLRQAADGLQSSLRGLCLASKTEREAIVQLLSRGGG